MMSLGPGIHAQWADTDEADDQIIAMVVSMTLQLWLGYR